MRAVLKGYLQLARPANLPSAAADIFAGAAIAGMFSSQSTAIWWDTRLIFLVLAAVFLYAGGVVLNDVFDMEVDKVERPERPIPSGLIPLKSAAFYGGMLLLLGTVMAFLNGNTSGIVSLILAACIVLYDAWAKKNDFLGPLNMGLCRGLNLVLGMSVLDGISDWGYASLPLIYIFAITLISRGEVHGDNKNHILWAALLYLLVMVSMAALVARNTDNLLQVIPFLGLFAFLVLKPLANAYRSNTPDNIKKAVKAGVLSLIVLDAAWVSGFSVWWYGLLLLLLLPLSLLLSKLFAVT